VREGERGCRRSSWELSRQGKGPPAGVSRDARFERSV
jgi:hypothetical protein